MNTKERAEDRRLKRVYGKSLSWYKRQDKKQKGVCAICGRPPKKLKLAVDHNHQTTLVRGLLCMICNRKIVGLIERYKIPLKALIMYFRTYDPQNPLLKSNGNQAK